MKKTKIIWIAVAVVLVVFLGLSMKVIDKGTEGQYTGEVAFDAGASSSGDWDAILAEITAGAQELSALDLSALGDGKAVTMKAVVTGFESKAKGKKNSITVLRDLQTVKAFGSFTNQTEWSQYGKAINEQMHAQVVEPLAIDESIQGKTITLTGGMTATGKDISITPVALAIE